MTIPKIPWKTISVQLSRHAPSILTGVGIGGFITATVMAAKATPKYTDDRRLKRIHITENAEDPNVPLENLPLKEEALLVGKHYWPTAIVVGTSAACIIFANHMNLQRQAALAAACSVSETMLKNYKAKAIEVLGPKEEKKQISDAIDQDYVSAHKEEILSDRNLYPIDMQIILDKYSGTKFYMTVEDVRQIVNEFNTRLIAEDCLSYSDLWNMLADQAANSKHIYEPDSTRAVGFKFEGNKSLIHADFTPIEIDNQHVIVVSFRPEPEADPWHYRC